MKTENQTKDDENRIMETPRFEQAQAPSPALAALLGQIHPFSIQPLAFSLSSSRRGAPPSRPGKLGACCGQLRSIAVNCGQLRSIAPNAIHL